MTNNKSNLLPFFDRTDFRNFGLFSNIDIKHVTFPDVVNQMNNRSEIISKESVP